MQFKVKKKNDWNCTRLCSWRILLHYKLHCWKWPKRGAETYKILYKKSTNTPS